MTRRPEDRKIVRRVLVPMDVSSEAREGLLFAARLARALESRLEGLFIEDQDLMSLAGLPFTRELSLTTGRPQSLDMDRLERDFRAKASAAQRLLAQVAQAENVPSSFRTARGKTELEITAAVREDDLVAVGRALGAVVGRGAQGGAIRTASRRPAGFILFTGHRPSARPTRVEAVVAGTPSCKTALRLAERLALALKVPLGIHIVGTAGRQDLEKWIQNTLADPAAARFQTADSAEDLLGALCGRPGRLVVTAAAALQHEHETIERLAARIACPLILVQQQAGDGSASEQPPSESERPA